MKKQLKRLKSTIHTFFMKQGLPYRLYRHKEGHIFDVYYKVLFYIFLKDKKTSHLAGYQYKDGHEPWNKGGHQYLGGKRFEKGRTPWNKDKKLGHEHGEKVAKTLKGKYVGEKNWNWKGLNVTYRTWHRWVEKNLPKPEQCDACNCKSSDKRRIYWVSKSGLNKRIKEDWIKLCTSCRWTYVKIVRELGKETNG